MVKEKTAMVRAAQWPSARKPGDYGNKGEPIGAGVFIRCHPYSMSSQLSSGPEGAKEPGVFRFPIKWEAKELLRVSQSSNGKLPMFPSDLFKKCH